MRKASSYLPPRFHNLTIHLNVNGAAAYIDFLKQAFDAVELSRSPSPDGRLLSASFARTFRTTLWDNTSFDLGGTMGTGLTPDQMKRFVRQHFEDFVNKRNAAVIRKNMTPEFYDHDGPGGKPTDVAGDEQMMVSMYEAMSDLHLTIEEMIAEGDKVVCRNVWRWTDPSGKKMQFHGFVLWRFEGDKIAERWATVTPPGDATLWTSWNAAPQAVAGKKAS